MFKALIKLIVVAAIGYGGWYGYTNYISSSQVNEQQARNYLPNIIKVSADQVKYLVLSGSRNQRPTLLYVFESGCFLCRWYYSDIVHFSKQYTRNQLNVMILSVDDDEISLASFFINNSPPVRPLMLKQGERESLFNHLRRLGSSYDGNVPHIAVINKAGHFDDITFSFDPRNKINGYITRSIDSKQ